MVNKTDGNFFRKLESGIEDRKAFNSAFEPAIEEIGKHIEDGNIVIKTDLAKVLLEYIQGMKWHDDALTSLVEREKNKSIPALERKPIDK